MIKLVNLFEDIKVEPRFTVIFKIPFDSQIDYDGDWWQDLDFSKAVEIRRESVLSELTSYMNVDGVDVVSDPDAEDENGVFEVRCISVRPEFPQITGLPEGLRLSVRSFDADGFVYLATRGRFLKPSELKDIFEGSIYPYNSDEDDEFDSPQSALDYLLFK